MISSTSVLLVAASKATAADFSGAPPFVGEDVSQVVDIALKFLVLDGLSR